MADHKKVFPTKTCEKKLVGFDGVRVGKIASVDTAGKLLVDYPGNDLGPLAARLTSTAKEKLSHNSIIGREVLLCFENNDPGIPVIIDTLYSLIDEIAEQSNSEIEMQKPDEISIDRKQIVFDAEEEIVLRCGDASITLTKTGKVLIKGSYLISRSTGANRIKGSSVQIN